jgi:hypothetical protein
VPKHPHVPPCDSAGADLDEVKVFRSLDWLVHKGSPLSTEFGIMPPIQGNWQDETMARAAVTNAIAERTKRSFAITSYRLMLSGRASQPAILVIWAVLQ